MQEKRKYIRVPITFKVIYTIEDGTSQPEKECLSRNISQGGILISSKTPLAVGLEMSMEIVSPTTDAPIRAMGRVVHVEEIEDHNLYEAGVSFTHISPTDVSTIKSFTEINDLDKLLNDAVSKGASDLHLAAGQPPIMRVHGELIPTSAITLSSENIKDLLHSILTPLQKERFETDLELDMSHATTMGRFRVNVHQEKGNLGAAFRHISSAIKSFDELGLPPSLKDLAMKPNGIILVTGPTGSGKTTTLAAMIDHINHSKKCMIISLEDPIEYVYSPRKSTIKQREIGSDSRSFVNALKHTLRQDVNVILVGEMRDLDSIAIALTAAETGHLVLTTLHTCDAVSTINRIIDVFPAERQQQIRMQISETLRGVVSQILLPNKDGDGRVVATEIMLCTTAIANTIRQGNTEQIASFMQTGAQLGMNTMDQSLERLYREGRLSKEVALGHVKDPKRFPA